MTDLPDIRGARRIAIDLETKDPLLTTHGPGEIRRDGFIAGLAVAVEEGPRWYFPMRHQTGRNLDPEQVLRWARDQLSDPRREIVGANLQYDLGWLAAEGVAVRAHRFLDVQLAEALIDENAGRYSLGDLAAKYQTGGKAEDGMYQWLADKFGGKPTRRTQAGRIWQAPPSVVREYALSDVDQPLKILRLQEKILEAEKLEKVWRMESDLIPMLLAMRQRGVRIDRDAAEGFGRKLLDKIGFMQAQLNELAGKEINPGAPTDLMLLFERLGLPVTRTAKGNPSFAAAVLAKLDHPAMRLIQEIQKLKKYHGTFVEGYLLKFPVNGRIHAQFHQAKGDANGTVSGRFSSSRPNLQNIPSRDEELGPLIRGFFLPEEGEDWISHDWSQVEYRLLVHFAAGQRAKGAEAAAEKFRNNPDTDFHQYCADLTGLSRKPAKNINFGLVYGMGIPALAANLGMEVEQAKPIFAQYHAHLPFVRETTDAITNSADLKGYIKTLSGRRRRYNTWEPRDFTLARSGRFKAVRDREALERMVMEYRDECREKGEDVPRAGSRRAFLHTSPNALIQGTAADIMKRAMLLIWRSGVCDTLGAPLLTVHDELCWSAPKTAEGREALAQAKEIMRTCVKLRVPLMVDEEKGESWGLAA